MRLGFDFDYVTVEIKPEPVPCRYGLQCRAGLECPYIHSDGDLIVFSRFGPAPDVHSLLFTRDCPRGAKCRDRNCSFVHPGDARWCVMCDKVELNGKGCTYTKVTTPSRRGRRRAAPKNPSSRTCGPLPKPGATKKTSSDAGKPVKRSK